MKTLSHIKPNHYSGSSNKASSEHSELQARPMDSEMEQGNFLNKIPKQEIEAVSRAQERISQQLKLK